MQVDAVTRKADEQKREADLKLTEFAQLLDIRAQRIKVTFPLLSIVLWLHTLHDSCDDVCSV